MEPRVFAGPGRTAIFQTSRDGRVLKKKLEPAFQSCKSQAVLCRLLPLLCGGGLAAAPHPRWPWCLCNRDFLPGGNLGLPAAVEVLHPYPRAGRPASSDQLNLSAGPSAVR